MVLLWRNLISTSMLLMFVGIIAVTNASVPYSLHGRDEDSEQTDDTRNNIAKYDIIDLDDTNFDITNNKANKPNSHKIRSDTLDQDSDNHDIEIGPYDDILDDVEVVKIDDEPLFQTLKGDTEAEKNETAVGAIGDDEDVNQGSGSGDIQIEIEENPQITNTTDGVKIHDEHSNDNHQKDSVVYMETRSTTKSTTTGDAYETVESENKYTENQPPYCPETLNITWASWSPWIRAGDADVRFRRCPIGNGLTSTVTSCEGNYIETRHCDHHDVTVCRSPIGELTTQRHVSCDGTDLDDVKDMGELRNPADRKDSCEYTLYDLKYSMPIGSTLSTDGLMAADPRMWCGSGDKYVPFYTQSERCLNNLRVFCKTSHKCKYEKGRRKQGKNKGDLNKECWRNSVLGGILPQGVPFGRSGKIICQRFSKDGRLGKLLGFKDDHFATLYDTSLRMPIMSMATVRVLGDDKWPNVPYMLEQGLILQDDTKVISTFYKDRKKGIIRLDDISDTCEIDKCKFGEYQAIPDDFEFSGYRIAPLITPEIIGGTLATQLSTFTLTNAAPMIPTVFSSWKRVLKAVRKFEEEECRIPITHYSDDKDTHTSRYGHELPEVYILSGTYASGKHHDVIGNDVTVPELFWLAVCCAHGADVASFGVYTHNEYQAKPEFVSVDALQTLLGIYNNYNQTNVKLYPAFDGVCSAAENDVSFKLYV